MSADLEHGRGDDSALRSGSAGAEGYLGHHPTPRQSSFAAQSQKASEDEFRQILDLAPLFVTVLGPKPINVGDASLFGWRAGLDFTAPTGGFDASRDLNQSSGFWSITPYVAATVLPVPKWEISAGLSYDYNFSTTHAANPPVSSGFKFHDGQAGQALWINFASSYEVFEGFRPGTNVYWLQQITDDRTNGLSVPFTRVQELYIGPGLSWQIDQRHIMNFNIYFPVFAKNTPAGPEFNIQQIIQF